MVIPPSFGIPLINWQSKNTYWGMAMAIPFHEKIKPPPLGGSPNEATGKWKYNPLKSEITAVMIHTDTYYTRVDTNQLNYMRMWKKQ